MTRHTFHVPVMGTGFTVDTPLRVARFGISSVISLVDDALLEQMREHHARQHGEAYQPIASGEDDARARRITAYLDLVDRQVRAQVDRMRAESFGDGGDLDRYFRLLPEGRLKRRHRELQNAESPTGRAAIARELIDGIEPGAIDVNIMTKLDRSVDAHGTLRPAHQSDALAALRGFCRSTVGGSVVLSAGMNARLYTYAGGFDELYPDATGAMAKRVTLKVSDFRSAEVQGKFLAKRGLWISEYRIESGINCGGHAFVTDGRLLGSVLDDFRTRKAALVNELFTTWCKVLAAQERPVPAAPPPVRVTVQGGIGTAAEDVLLRDWLGADGTGWGTPFLMVPEVTRVDDETRRALGAAGPDDVQLSAASPLGVPFWNLMTSASEEARRQRIATSRPGSACPKGYLATPPEPGAVPLCPASRGYQRRKLTEAGAVDHEAITAKSCICHDLGGSATLSLGIDPQATPAICPGPNIVHFHRDATLEEMVDHIYGRADVLLRPGRPHMLVEELRLYLDHLEREAAAGRAPAEKMIANLRAGARFYEDDLAPATADPDAFRLAVRIQRERLEALVGYGETRAPQGNEAPAVT